MKDQHALLLAITLHNGQMRRGNTEPYVCHTIRVADSVYNFNTNPLMYQAALLHDVVEDTDVTLNDLETTHGIPNETCVLIDLLTKRPDESREAYIARLVESKNSDAMFIKIMDSLDNATMRLSDIPWYIENKRDMYGNINKYINTAVDLLVHIHIDEDIKRIISHNIKSIYKASILVADKQIEKGDHHA